jgi:hypothetical protein
MSARELLRQVSEQLRELPAEEQERFFDEILALDVALPVQHDEATKHSLRWPDIHARHRRIFGGTVLPENIVLAAREEEEH